MSEPTTATLKVKVDGHEKRLDGHDVKFKDHEDWLVKITNRPPVWVGIIITFLTGLVCAGAAAVITYVLKV